MSKSKYTAYSEARSIARKRLERMTAAGYVDQSVRFPSVKELKQKGLSVDKALRSVNEFLSSAVQLKNIKKQPAETRTVFRKSEYGVSTTILEKVKRQEQQRSYRERVKSLTDDQRALIKAARRLGLKIGPATVKPFEEYVKYRYSQGIGSVPYFMANIIEDYLEVTKGRRRHPEEVLSDYERFLANRQELISSWEAIIKGQEPTAQTSDEFSASWIEYIKYRDAQMR